MAYFDILIVGAGHAGAQLAIMLRQREFEGTIAIVGEESEYPYERPPLSKDYLSGDKDFGRILIRPPASWAERRINLLLAKRVVEVFPENHTVCTDDGDVIGYGRLVWATGGYPRRLGCRGHDLNGVHSVRNRADIDRMIVELPLVNNIVVVGGGYIGLEAAAVLSKLGKGVTVVEAQPRVLARVASETLSRFYEAEHRSHGVEFRLGADVRGFEGESKVTGVALATGEILPADMVIVGIGIVPAVEELAAAGAAGDNGVLVDTLCRTSLTDIFAIGDCAAHINSYAGNATIRLESVQNAHDQAMTVAQHLTGADEPYNAVPWFWSNQYDLKLQSVGISTGYDHVVTRGDMSRRSFSLVYLRDNRVIALDCVNAARDYVQGRALLGRVLGLQSDVLANAEIPLKNLA
jgi:3-phenylpropionate/trans-cinnamate dioxygenase ferredoxin reductase subunit